MSDSIESPPFPAFREAFCHAYRCRPRSFSRRALVRAIPLWRRPFALPVLWVAPWVFGMDLHILDLLGKTRSKNEFSQLLDEFHNAMRVTRSWSKRWLGLRMSGASLIELRDELDALIMPGERPPDTSRLRMASGGSLAGET